MAYKARVFHRGPKTAWNGTLVLENHVHVPSTMKNPDDFQRIASDLKVDDIAAHCKAAQARTHLVAGFTSTRIPGEEFELVAHSLDPTRCCGRVVARNVVVHLVDVGLRQPRDPQSHQKVSPCEPFLSVALVTTSLKK